MALLSIAEASRATDKDRGTIQRYLKRGIISGSTDNTGKIKIDTSELLRVFGELKASGAVDTAKHQSPRTTKDAIPLTAIDSLTKQLQAAQEREEWLKRQLEAEKEHARAIEDELEKVRNRELEAEREHNREIQRLLALPEGNPDGKPKKRGFFARLFHDTSQGF